MPPTTRESWSLLQRVMIERRGRTPLPIVDDIHVLVISSLPPFVTSGRECGASCFFMSVFLRLASVRDSERERESARHPARNSQMSVKKAIESQRADQTCRCDSAGAVAR